MVLVGVSFENNSSNGSLELEAVVLQKAKGFKVGDTFSLGKFKAAGSDEVEGVTFVGGDIYAISESEGKDIVVKVDLPSKKVSSSNISGARFGDDAGFDAVNTKLGFNIQGNDEATFGNPVGNRLYRLTPTKAGPFTKSRLIKVRGKGFSDFEFADGLAVTNKNTFLASDFESADGDGANPDGNELYQFKFNKRGTKVNFVKSADVIFKGTAIVASDSGLDFIGGKLYAVTDSTNQIWRATSGVTKSGTLTGGAVVFTEVTSFSSSSGNFDGLAVANIPSSDLSDPTV